MIFLSGTAEGRADISRDRQKTQICRIDLVESIIIDQTGPGGRV